MEKKIINRHAGLHSHQADLLLLMFVVDVHCGAYGFYSRHNWPLRMKTLNWYAILRVWNITWIIAASRKLLQAFICASLLKILWPLAKFWMVQFEELLKTLWGSKSSSLAMLWFYLQHSSFPKLLIWCFNHISLHIRATILYDIDFYLHWRL